MSLLGVYQIGYVTTDIDRAIPLMARGSGLSDFARYDLQLQLRTSQGDKTAEVRVGTAWVGATQIELIQPLSGFVEHYLAGLPENDDPTPRFHHLAVRREDKEAMDRNVAEFGLPVLFETGGAGVDSVFVDARTRLGHYLEFVSASQAGWQMLGWPDRHDAN